MRPITGELGDSLSRVATLLMDDLAHRVLLLAIDLAPRYCDEEHGLPIWGMDATISDRITFIQAQVEAELRDLLDLGATPEGLREWILGIGLSE